MLYLTVPYPCDSCFFLQRLNASPAQSLLRSLQMSHIYNTHHIYIAFAFSLHSCKVYMYTRVTSVVVFISLQHTHPFFFFFHVLQIRLPALCWVLLILHRVLLNSFEGNPHFKAPIFSSHIVLKRAPHTCAQHFAHVAPTPHLHLVHARACHHVITVHAQAQSPQTSGTFHFHFCLSVFSCPSRKDGFPGFIFFSTRRPSVRACMQICVVPLRYSQTLSRYSLLGLP